MGDAEILHPGTEHAALYEEFDFLLNAGVHDIAALFHFFLGIGFLVVGRKGLRHPENHMSILKSAGKRFFVQEVSLDDANALFL